MSYFRTAEDAAQRLGLELLGQAEPDARALVRHTRLAACAAGPVPSGSAWSRIAAHLGAPSRHNVIWFAAPYGGMEQLPWAVGIAELLARGGGEVLLGGPQIAALLPLQASARTFALPKVARERLGDRIGPNDLAISTDLEGVRLVVPRSGSMSAPEESVGGDWTFLWVESLPEELGAALPREETFDGVAFVASFRDHSPFELEACTRQLQGAGHPLLGIIAIGPVAGAEAARAESPSSKPRPAAPASSASRPPGKRSKPGSIWDDSKASSGSRIRAAVPPPTRPPVIRDDDGESHERHEVVDPDREVTQTSWAHLSVKSPTNPYQKGSGASQNGEATGGGHGSRTVSPSASPGAEPGPHTGPGKGTGTAAPGTGPGTGSEKGSEKGSGTALGSGPGADTERDTAAAVGRPSGTSEDPSKRKPSRKDKKRRKKGRRTGETTPMTAGAAAVAGGDVNGTEGRGSGSHDVGAHDSGTDRSGTDKSGVDISGTDKSGTDKSGSDKSGVDTSGANISGSGDRGPREVDLDLAAIRRSEADPDLGALSRSEEDIDSPDPEQAEHADRVEPTPQSTTAPEASRPLDTAEGVTITDPDFDDADEDDDWDDPDWDEEEDQDQDDPEEDEFSSFQDDSDPVSDDAGKSHSNAGTVDDSWRVPVHADSDWKSRVTTPSSRRVADPETERAPSTGFVPVEELNAEPEEPISPAVAAGERVVPLMTMWEREQHRKNNGRVVVQVFSVAVALLALSTLFWFATGRTVEDFKVLVGLSPAKTETSGSPATQDSPGALEQPGETSDPAGSNPNGTDASAPDSEGNGDSGSMNSGASLENGLLAQDVETAASLEDDRVLEDSRFVSQPRTNGGSDVTPERLATADAEPVGSAGSVGSQTVPSDEVDEGSMTVLSDEVGNGSTVATPEEASAGPMSGIAEVEDAAPAPASFTDDDAAAAPASFTDDDAAAKPASFTDEDAAPTPASSTDDDAAATSTGSTAPPAESTTGYVIQLSSFQTQERADTEVARLRDRGLDVHIVEADIPERGKWFRVVTGQFATSQEARAHALDRMVEWGIRQAYVAGRGGLGNPLPVALPDTSSDSR